MTHSRSRRLLPYFFNIHPPDSLIIAPPAISDCCGRPALDSYICTASRQPTPPETARPLLAAWIPNERDVDANGRNKRCIKDRFLRNQTARCCASRVAYKFHSTRTRSWLWRDHHRLNKLRIFCMVQYTWDDEML